MLARIVGFEIPVLKIEAKFKLGQNRRVEDRAGTIEGLDREVSADGLALAAFMSSRIGGFVYVLAFVQGRHEIILGTKHHAAVWLHQIAIRAYLSILQP